MKFPGFTLAAYTTKVQASKLSDYLRELSPLTNSSNVTQMNYSLGTYAGIASNDAYKKASKSHKSSKAPSKKSSKSKKSEMAR